MFQKQKQTKLLMECMIVPDPKDLSKHKVIFKYYYENETPNFEDEIIKQVRN